MQALIAYGTTDGHTQKVASEIAGDLKQRSFEVQTVDVSQPLNGIALADYDVCIVEASVRQKQYSEAVISFVSSNTQALNDMPSAFVSVSMAAAFAEGHPDAESYVTQLLRQTGWKPAIVHHAAGALRSSRYDYFQEQIIRHIVLKDHQTELTSGDHEFTDWKRLKRFLDTFYAISTDQESAAPRDTAG